ncbi:MAG: ADOP family duplicated permease [Acidobacteria bacterium]|nr:ADOP family duplicated permease [Acidobacteriota bacterium]
MLSILSQAWQSWKSAKAVAVLAAIALAVGIGSTTAIYTVVNAVLLKPLPYARGDRFVALYAAKFSEPRRRGSNGFRDLYEYQQRVQSFDVFGWFKQETFNLTSPGQPQHINGAVVTPSLAHNLGVNPMIGRWFPDEASAVISNALWKRLGASPDFIGQAITLNDRKYTVTGVMPAWFRFPLPGPGVADVQNDVWISLDPQGKRQHSGMDAYFCYARLKPGITFSQAEADVKRVAAEIAKLDPASHPSYTARLDDLRESVIIGIRPTLLLLFAAAGLLLLITCANVAGLLLARAVARARETAIRVALGAAQRQLALQYFSEGLLVSLAGAAAGVLLSIALVRIVVSIAAEFIPRVDEVAIDWTALLFALGVAFLAAALSSLAPLWQAVRTLPNEVLNDGVRASAGARSRKLSQSLVIAEIALAFTLLAVGAVLIAHLGKLTRIWPGFDPDHLLTFQLTVPETISSNSVLRVQHQKRLTDALEAIPGVSSAAFVNQLPLSCCLGGPIYPEGRPVNLDVGQRNSFLILSPGYFRTMRIPLKSGRFLTEHDTSDDPLFVVINQAAATKYWPNQDPIGASGRIGHPSGSRFQVVGISGDVRNESLGNPTVPEIALLSLIIPVNPMRFVVRSSLPAEKLIPEVRRAVQSIDPTQPIHDVMTMDDIVQISVALERVGSFMTIFFALAALLMATLGIYGVVSYSVRQRTVEIGTRLALGAVRRDILSLVIGGGLKMAGYAVAIGTVAVIASAWLLFRVFEIHDVGLLPFVFSAAIVLGVAIVASFFPAWRATLLSPMVAIRNEPGSMWQSARQSIRRAVKGISHAVSRAGDTPILSAGTLLTEFVEAARRAASSTEAIQIALATLCSKIGAESGILLENVSGQEYRCAAAIHERESSDYSLPAHGFLLNRLKFHALPLPLTSGDFDTWLRWAKEYKPKYLAEIQTLQAIDARIAVSLRTKSEILGVLLLGPPVGREEYSSAEKQVLRNCAEQFALMIENARLTDRVVEQEKLRRDLALAAEVQRRLLPEQPPEAGVAALAAVSLPARSIGGDYYDFLDVGDHRIGIALADIAGKGIAAALIMSVVQASLRIISAEGDISLPQLAAKMNRFLHRSTKSNSYATFFYAEIDERNRQLRYVNAGHNPPYLLRPNDAQSTGSTANSISEIQELSAGGTVLGLFPQMSYQEATVDLKSGDVLIIFTDGVTEALNPKEEEFGEERLKESLRQLAHLPVHEISSRISEELRSWIKDAAQHDDLTFIVMKVN